MTARERAQEFLDTRGDFRLGHLLTEGFHPATEGLDELAREDPAAAILQVLEVDRDVVAAYHAWLDQGTYPRIGAEVAGAIAAGRRAVFVGCGATGRLSVQLEHLWRQLWRGTDESVAAGVVSVPAGGDFALVRSVEGFEDRAELAERQLGELAIGDGDVVFAVTEGGETPFVLGGARYARSRGARVFLVYCNPDELLETIPRSRAVLHDGDVEKIRLVTGPMAISGSTRMQATGIQQLALFTVLAAAASALDHRLRAPTKSWGTAFANARDAVASLAPALADLVGREESAYRRGSTAEYVAGRFALDVLTDTTERAPTFGVPPFRQHGDDLADDAWARLFCAGHTPAAWQKLLQRLPRCLGWTDLPVDVTEAQLLRYRIGADGPWRERVRRGSYTLVIHGAEDADDRAFMEHMAFEVAGRGADTAAISVGEDAPLPGVDCVVHLPGSDEVFDLIGHATLKMALNAMSTVVMARLGRVIGNCMACVTPTNNKLIDRATRYVAHLGGIEYDQACRLVFAALEDVEPALRAGRSFPPVVLSAIRAERE